MHCSFMARVLQVNFTNDIRTSGADTDTTHTHTFLTEYAYSSQVNFIFSTKSLLKFWCLTGLYMYNLINNLLYLTHLP